MSRIILRNAKSHDRKKLLAFFDCEFLDGVNSIDVHPGHRSELCYNIYDRKHCKVSRFKRHKNKKQIAKELAIRSQRKTQRRV